MIYINSNIVSFPRHSRSEVVLLHLVNQLTQTNFEVEVTNTSTNPKLYTFDLSSAMLQLIAGQYDYYLYSLDKSVIGNGILQVEDYTTEDVNYNIEYNIIQYSPEDEQIIIPIRKLTIIENGEYDVTDYEKVIVDVDTIDEEVIEEMQQHIDNLTTRVEQLEEEVDSKDEEIAELNKENDNLEATNTTLNSELESANEEISSLTLNVQYLENQNTTLNSELESANAEIDNLEAEVQEKQAYIDTATAITITENGTYTPPTGVVGYNSISVEVSGGITPKYVLSNGTKLGYSTSSTDINNFIFSEISDFSRMFSYCENLTSIPAIDTSKGTNFDSMFYYCENLTSIPTIDTSKGTRFDSMFYYCMKLTEIPLIDTSNGTRFTSMFSGCSNLATIPLINVSKITYRAYLNFTFSNCPKLENITFEGHINYDIDFSASPLLSFDSIKSILTAASKTTNTSSKTLKFNRSITDVDGELAALVATCASKGWTISGLTLE